MMRVIMLPANRVYQAVFLIDKGWVGGLLEKIGDRLAIFYFYARIDNCENKKRGSVPEWLMGADCKSADYVYAGSNPARPTTLPIWLRGRALPW